MSIYYRVSPTMIGRAAALDTPTQHEQLVRDGTIKSFSHYASWLMKNRPRRYTIINRYLQEECAEANKMLRELNIQR